MYKNTTEKKTASSSSSSLKVKTPKSLIDEIVDTIAVPYAIIAPYRYIERYTICRHCIH